MKISSPIIVIGPPRSGTSAIARILHQHLDVVMGFDFPPPAKKANPNGFWEDITLVKLSKDFLSGKISFAEHETGFIDWIKRAQGTGKPWGFKIPQMNPRIFGLVLTLFDNPTIIRCHRAKEKVIKSMTEKIKLGEDPEKVYDLCTIGFDRLLKGRPIINIDMNKRRTDEEIIQVIFSGQKA